MSVFISSDGRFYSESVSRIIGEVHEVISNRGYQHNGVLVYPKKQSDGELNEYGEIYVAQ